MTAHVLLNPAARGGRNRALREPLARALAAAGVEAEIIETTGPGDAERRAAEIGADGGLVVSAGGDGTLHEVVNGLAGTAATLGVLPLGTGNDFAHALGMPNRLADAARALVDAPVTQIDLGTVRWTEADGSERTRHFANCLGMGFDAHAAGLAAHTKWMGGRAAYLGAVLRTLWAWRRPDLAVRVDASDLAFEGPLFLCEVGNGHSIGGGFLTTPDARPDDGLLDVCLVRHIDPRRALRLLPQTFSGRHVSAPEVTMAQTTRLSLTVTASRRRGLGLQADGESLTGRAVRVEVGVEPGALAARAPRVGRRETGGKGALRIVL